MLVSTQVLTTCTYGLGQSNDAQHLSLSDVPKTLILLAFPKGHLNSCIFGLLVRHLHSHPLYYALLFPHLKRMMHTCSIVHYAHVVPNMRTENFESTTPLVDRAPTIFDSCP